MADFRAERLFIRVNGALNFDPNEGINVAAFADAMVDDGHAYDRPSLQEYSFAPFEVPRWFPAYQGMATVQAVIEEKENELANAEPSRKAYLEECIHVLQVVHERLDAIDTKDVEFYFLIRDLG